MPRVRTLKPVDTAAALGTAAAPYCGALPTTAMGQGAPFF